MRIGRANGETKFIIAGTIMHMDSALESLMPNAANEKHKIERQDALSIRGVVGEWHSVKYRAHPAMNDFSQLLWPERMTEDYLRREQDEYRRQGLLDVYGQELLNDPIDESVAFFRIDDIREPPTNKNRQKRIFAAWDTALSTVSKGDWTVALVIFEMQRTYHPEWQVFEKGQIEKAILPMVESQMHKRQTFINIEQRNSGPDITVRCQAIRARVRSRTVCADKELVWWPELEDELRRFPRGKHDDQCQALGLIGRMLAEMLEAPTDEEFEDELYHERVRESDAVSGGRDVVTGY